MPITCSMQNALNTPTCVPFLGLLYKTEQRNEEEKKQRHNIDRYL